MAPLGILLKFLVPLLGFYLIQKWIRNALNPSQDYSGNPEQKQTKSRGDRADDVIEICPECGNVMLRNHQCKFNS